jgi:hypothetical protein
LLNAPGDVCRCIYPATPFHAATGFVQEISVPFDKLSELLPERVDKMTPGGVIPEG